MVAVWPTATVRSRCGSHSLKLIAIIQLLRLAELSYRSFDYISQVWQPDQIQTEWTDELNDWNEINPEILELTHPNAGTLSECLTSSADSADDEHNRRILIQRTYFDYYSSN